MLLRKRNHLIGESRQTLYSSAVLATVGCVGTILLWIRFDRAHDSRPPLYTPGCGDWQHNYAKLHRQIIGGHQGKRLCIATTQAEKGLYDRLSGECLHEASASAPRVRSVVMRRDHHAVHIQPLLAGMNLNCHTNSLLHVAADDIDLPCRLHHSLSRCTCYRPRLPAASAKPHAFAVGRHVPGEAHQLAR